MTDVVPHIPLGPDGSLGTSTNAGLPGRDPLPGGNIPSEVPPNDPDEMPDIGPSGPRTPYPVDDPGIGDPVGPGSAPDYLPGSPTSPTSPMQV